MGVGLLNGHLLVGLLSGGGGGVATSQQGMACTPRDPKCGRFCFIFLNFGQIPPPSDFWPGVASQGGGRGMVNPPSRS